MVGIKVIARLRQQIHSMARNTKVVFEHSRLLFRRLGLKHNHSDFPPVIVSLTSYPPRIRGSWVAIESILAQTVVPRAVILTLALPEFPNRKLPWSIRRQVRRGLEIAWVEENGRSYDKLLPTMVNHPDVSIVIVDDDKILPPTFLEDLLTAHIQSPSAIVGYRGWEMVPSGGQVKFGLGWRRAGLSTLSNRLFFAGNAGVLYPPKSLGPEALDMKAALELAPTADDIWFWACATVAGTPMKCLGKPAHTSVLSQKRTPALNEINEDQNDRQFQAVLDYFGIREKVLLAISPQD